MAFTPLTGAKTSGFTPIAAQGSLPAVPQAVVKPTLGASFREAIRPSNLLTAAKDVGIGIAQSVPRAAIGLGGVIESGLDQTAGRVLNASSGKGFTPLNTGQKVQENLDTSHILGAKNSAQKTGQVAGDLLQYLVPGSGEVKVAETAGKLAKLAAKYGPQAVRDAVIGTGQTGSAKEGGIIGGASLVLNPALDIAVKSILKAIPKNKIAQEELTKFVDNVLTEKPSLQKLPVTGESVATNVPIASQYRKELPIIDYGVTPRDTSGLPTIQTNTPLKKGFLTYEPIDQLVEKSKPFIPLERPAPPISDRLSPGVPEVVKPIETTGTGNTKTRGLSQGVEAKAIENDLTTNFGDLPEYQSVSMKDQAEKATQILSDHPELAKSIALGTEQAPKGVLPESVFVAVEKQAIKNGDVTTLRQLATGSKLTSEATTMGQRIRTLAERNPDSPVKAINDVVKARIERALRVGIKDVAKTTKEGVKEIKTHIAKVPKESWDSFITSITC